MNMSCFFAFINSWSLFIACVGVKTSLQSSDSKLLQVSNMSHPLMGGMIHRSVAHLQSYMCHSQRGNAVSWQLWVTNGHLHIVCWQWYLNKIYWHMTYIIHNNNNNRGRYKSLNCFFENPFCPLTYVIVSMWSIVCRACREGTIY